MENELATLKAEVLSYCDRREANGGKVAEYTSPCCQKTLKTAIPDKKGEKWDSAVKCYECGELHYVVKTINGVNANSFN